MTDREKLRTFGGYYLGIARNYDKAVETYEELVAKFPSDSAGYNNLAIAYFSLLNFAKALEHGRKAIEIYPRPTSTAPNYALYAMYAGDFPTAATTAQALIKEDPKTDVAYLPLAMEALTSGDHARARATYVQAAGAGESGASGSGIGLADVAMYRRAVRGGDCDAAGERPGATRIKATLWVRRRSWSRSPKRTPRRTSRHRAKRRSPGHASCRRRTVCWCRRPDSQ